MRLRILALVLCLAAATTQQSFAQGREPVQPHPQAADGTGSAVTNRADQSAPPTRVLRLRPRAAVSGRQAEGPRSGLRRQILGIG